MGIKFEYKTSNENLDLSQLSKWLINNLDLPINKKCLKYIIYTMQHEAIHCKIYNFFNVKNVAELLLKAEERDILWVNGLTHANYEKSNIKFYFVELIQTLYDVIYDIFYYKSFIWRIFFYVNKMLGRVELLKEI